MKYARVYRLSFEMPKPDSDVVIRAEIHYVNEDDDGNVTKLSGTQAEIFRLLPSVAGESIDFVDPVKRSDHQVTVAGLSSAITQVVRGWMFEEITGQVDSQGRYVLEP